MAKKKGLGDIVKAVTDVIGIEPCEGCKKNKDWLNVNFAFNKPLPLTDLQKQRMEKEPREVYNEAFGTTIAEEQFIGGVRTSILKKLTKLLNYENN